MKQPKTNKELLLSMQKQIKALNKKVKQLEEEDRYIRMMTGVFPRGGPLCPM